MSENFHNVYKNLSDDKLLHLAKYEYDDLILDAQIALDTEINLRNLKRNVSEYKKAKTKTYSNEEIIQISQQYRDSDCPICGKKNNQINRYKYFTFYFFYLIVFWKNRILFGCKDCLIKKLKKYIVIYGFLALLLPFQTIISIIQIIVARKLIKKIDKKNHPSDDFYNYIEDNIAEVVTELKKKKSTKKR